MIENFSSYLDLNTFYLKLYLGFLKKSFDKVLLLLQKKKANSP